MKTRNIIALFILTWLSIGAMGQRVRTDGIRGTGNLPSLGNPIGGRSGFNPNNPNALADTTSQEEDQGFKGIDYDHVEETDSALVSSIYIFSRTPHTAKILEAHHPVLSPYGIATFDATQLMNRQYLLTAGGWGHPHYSLLSSSSQQSWICPDVNYAYADSLQFFQVLRPYTVLADQGSLNKDNLLRIVHTQNITNRWNFALAFNLINREGTYTRSKVANRYLNFSTNYYSDDSRYQVQGGWQMRNISIEENGGVQSDEFFQSGNQSNMAGIPINLYSAGNQWKSHTVFVNQSYNTVRQIQRPHPIKTHVFLDTIITTRVATDSSYTSRKDTTKVIRDSIIRIDTLYPGSNAIFNSGVFGARLSFSTWRRQYYDAEPLLESYPYLMFDNSLVLDSTQARTLMADVYWTNDAFLDYKWHNPFKITLGIKPQIKSVRMAYQIDQWATLPIYGHLDLKNLLNIEASVVTSNNYEAGDHSLSGRLHHSFGNTDSAFFQSVQLMAQIEHHAPQYIYQRYISNTGYWDHLCSFFHPGPDRFPLEKIASQSLHLDYQFQRNFHSDSSSFLADISVVASSINNNVWIAEDLHPYQTDQSALLYQSRLSAKLSLHWFHFETEQYLQHATNADIIRVPLWASKNSFYGDFHLFHNALWIETGFDVRYHTRFLADAYSPALGLFYRQDEVMVGNYPWIDFFVTLKVKQANIYARVTNLTAPLLKERNYFILPHTPGDALGIFWGVTWNFFN